MADLSPVETKSIDKIRMGLLIPTLNAGPAWSDFIDALARQELQPIEVLVMDSGSTDTTVNSALKAKFTILKVAPSEFNHGGTRNEGMMHFLGRIDYLVCMTQDAILTNSESLQELLKSFHDLTVGAAFGRQLPHVDATPLAVHARLFNYPNASRALSIADKARLGLKTCFISNSFAAYRVEDLMAVGGFPADVILGEDMSVAARLLMAGKRVAYVADACAYHSHNYTLLQDFRRYFDTGVFHARNPWLLQTFGSAGGEGLRFVRSELSYLLKHAPGFIPSAMMRTLAKWLGYKLGKAEAVLPLAFKRWCSMHSGYWNNKSR